MSKSNVEKSKDDTLKQMKMGDFFSKESKKTGEKKRKVKSPDTSMWSSFWTRGAYRDTEEYRNKYPGKKDNENLDDNYQFYMNRIPSKPDGDFIDSIHANWFGDYRRLEIHHGYIQWLFPIRDTGMNWHAQELQLHEIEKLTKSRAAKKRILMSYKMMLDFYGMILKNESTGELERAENWKERFRHLNSSYHNYLRITRILKSLGEFDFEHLKAGFVRFILYEGMVEDTLDNLIDSCVKYWIGVLRNDEEREDVLDYYEELLEKQKTEEYKSKKRAKSASPEPKIKVKTGPSRYVNKFDTDEDSETEADMAQYNDMDLLADTLPFENDIDEESDNVVENENADTKGKGTAKTNKGNLRIVHDMSDSDNNEEFQTPDVDESQEASYWAKNDKTVDKSTALDGTLKPDISVEIDMAEREDLGMNGVSSTEVNSKETANGKGEEENVCTQTENTVGDENCSDQVDGAITSKKSKCRKSPDKTTKESGCDGEKVNEIKETAMEEVIDEEKENTDKKSATGNNSIEEIPMETGDDGNIMV